MPLLTPQSSPLTVEPQLLANQLPLGLQQTLQPAVRAHVLHSPGPVKHDSNMTPRLPGSTQWGKSVGFRTET